MTASMWRVACSTWQSQPVACSLWFVGKQVDCVHRVRWVLKDGVHCPWSAVGRSEPRSLSS